MNDFMQLSARLPDVEIKEQRLRAGLAEKELDAEVISRQDNLAWITSGGDARVVNSVPEAFTLLILTTDGEKVAVAHAMDGPRSMDEEIAGLVFLHINTAGYLSRRQVRARARAR